VEHSHHPNLTAGQAAPPVEPKGGEPMLQALRRNEEGQTMAEYGVVLAVITLAVIGAITLLSDNVRSAIESVANILP